MRMSRSDEEELFFQRANHAFTVDSTRAIGSLPACSHALTKLLSLTAHLKLWVSPVTRSVFDAALADSLFYEH